MKEELIIVREEKLFPQQRKEIYQQSLFCSSMSINDSQIEKKKKRNNE